MKRRQKAPVEKETAVDTRLIGYARVSTDDQDLRMQVADLKSVGVDARYIFVDKKSGATLKRRGLQEAMAVAQAGDVFIVWRFDRLSRSLKDLIDILDHLRTRGIQLRSLKEGIDTTTAIGMMFFQLIGVFAEFERNLTSERTKSGSKAAKEAGAQIGAARKMTDKQVAKAVELLTSKRKSVPQIAEMFGVSWVTVRKEVFAVTGTKLWKTGPHAGKRRERKRYTWAEVES